MKTLTQHDELLVKPYIDSKIQTLTNQVKDMNNVYGSKNLLPNGATTQVKNGVTFTVNEDGSVTANGTATAFTAFDVETTLTGLIVRDGNYILSDGLDEPNMDHYTTITVVDTSDVTTYDYANTKDVGKDRFSIQANRIKYLFLAVCIDNGVTVSNLTFYPMVRLASIQDDTYVPYSMTNQEMTPYVKAISNPNLLDNPWFTVNQRGATSVTTTWTHFADRWRTGNNAYNLVINNDKTITFKAGGKTEINQAIEYDRFNLGKVYTLSVMLSDGTIRSVSGVIEQKSQWTRLFAVKLSDTDDIWASIDVDQIYVAASIYVIDNLTTDLTIKAIKLELGSVSTLAQDTAPNYATELLKCQRYFYRITNRTSGAFANVWFQSASQVNGIIHLPVAMRIYNPTVSLTGTIYCNSMSHIGASGIQSQTLGVKGQGTNDFTIYVVITGGTAGEAGWLQFRDANSYLDISTDL